MADRGAYRSIKVVILDGPDFQLLPERARHAFLVLKMSFGPCGLEVRYPEALAHEVAAKTGMPAEAARESLTLLEVRDWIRRDGNVFWIVGQLEHDPGQTPNNENHRKSIQSHLSGLPRLNIVRRFVDAHPDYFPPSEYILPDGYPMPCDSHRDTYPITEEVRGKREEVIPKSETDTHTAREDEFSSWLNGHSAALDAYPLLRDRRLRRTLLAWYGPNGMRSKAWERDDGTPTPEADRPRILASAASGYAAEGKAKLVDREFDKKLRGHIRDEYARPRDGPPPNGASSPLTQPQFAVWLKLREEAEKRGVDPEKAAESTYEEARRSA